MILFSNARVTSDLGDERGADEVVVDDDAELNYSPTLKSARAFCKPSAHNPVNRRTFQMSFIWGQSATSRGAPPGTCPPPTAPVIVTGVGGAGEECPDGFDWQTVGAIARRLSFTGGERGRNRGIGLDPDVEVPSKSRHPRTGSWYLSGCSEELTRLHSNHPRACNKDEGVAVGQNLFASLDWLGFIRFLTLSISVPVIWRKMGKVEPITSLHCATLCLLVFLLSLHFGVGEARLELEGVEARRTAESGPEVHCSRERSRAAWKIIEEYLMPFVDEHKYQISSKCRLHSSNDMFREQEGHKVHVDVNEWRCGFCQKRFRAEKYLDMHFDNRHYNLLNDTQGPCLADLCGALHCDQVMEFKKPKIKCNPAAVARNRHLCESLADSCFPVNQGPLESRLHEFFLRQFCDSHTCSGGHKPFSRGGRKESSILYLAVCILLVLLLPLFYLLVFLSRREMKDGVQVLKRITKVKQKK